MESDATFVIGSGHEVCQDWAAAGAHWALVADGCSGAPRSDFGARLVGRAAERALTNASFSPRAVIRRAADHAAQLGLSPRCLDATLLAAWKEGPVVQVVASGDGLVAAQRRDGVIEAWSIEHPDNAPAYLSYLLDEDRLRRYLADHGRRRIVHHVIAPTGDDRQRVVAAPLPVAPWVARWAFDAQRYAVIAVMSDGASALRPRPGRLDPLPLSEVLGGLFDFKRYRGRFVRRRLRSLLRRRSWELGDDLAVAALANLSTTEARAA